MARVVDTLYNQTSAAAGTLTADLATSKYCRLLLVAKTVGVNATTTYTINDYSTGAAIVLATLTAVGGNASRADGVGPGMTATGSTSSWPVPITTRFVVTAGASTTVQLIVYGVIEDGL
jgi:hypothetical protein